MRAKFSSAFRQSLIFALVIGSAELLATTPASAAAPNPTTTTLASDPTSGAMGTVFTLTATVTVGGKPVTAGSVQFTDGRRVLGSVQVIISGPSVGTAVLKTNSFGVGAHSVTASYSGAPNSAQSTAPSKSTPAAITITGLAPTSTSLHLLPSTTQQGTYDITATLLAASSAIGYGTLTVDQVLPNSSINLGNAPVTTIPGFLPAQTLPETGVGAVGDLNGDGIPDLVLATRNSSNTQAELLVQFGDPNHPGQFLPAVTYPLASIADWIAIGDVNGDGLSDVVVDGIGVFLNDPAHPGQLQPEQLIADPLGFYGTPILADLNGDGVLDLAGADGTDGVTVYFGDPAHPGQFLAQQSINLGVANAYSLLITDFNQDGLNDLAVLTQTYGAQGGSSSTISIFFADPLHPGQFVAGGAYPAPDGGVVELLGDFNGDGLPDILSGSTLLVNQAAHPGTFSSVPSNANSFSFANAVVVADLNGDGTSDLIGLTIAYPPFPGSATVLLSNPVNPGQFTASGTYTIGVAYYTSDFATAVDINGDGQPDLIAAGGDGTIVSLGTQTGTVSLPNNIVVPGSGISTLQASYTGDAHYQASSSPITPIGTSALPTTNLLTRISHKLV